MKGCDLIRLTGNTVVAFLAFFSLTSCAVHLAYRLNAKPPALSYVGTSASTAGDLEVTLLVERIEERPPGDRFLFELTLRNRGEAGYARKMELPLFDLYVYDERGERVAEWSEGQEFPDYILPIILFPGEVFTETKVWAPVITGPENGDKELLKNGRYELSGIWLGGPTVETGMIRFTITNTPQEGSSAQSKTGNIED